MLAAPFVLFLSHQMPSGKMKEGKNGLNAYVKIRTYKINVI